MNTCNSLVSSSNLHRVGIRNISDYSPFGVLLPERTVEGADFKWGYQGSERDDETKGQGNSYTTLYRQLDPRLGRWLIVDPEYTQSLDVSPYSSMENSPILLNDPDGDIIPLVVALVVYAIMAPEYVNEPENKYNPGTALEHFTVMASGTAGIRSATQDFSHHQQQLKSNTTQRNTPSASTNKPTPKKTTETTVKNKATTTQKNTTKSTNGPTNKKAGTDREAQEMTALSKQYGKGSVQSEMYLRNSKGELVKDPITGEARRIDFVVIKDGKAVDVVETTSLNANKSAQIAKENRIRNMGGVYVKDKVTGKLVNISKVKTRISRRE